MDHLNRLNAVYQNHVIEAAHLLPADQREKFLARVEELLHGRPIYDAAVAKAIKQALAEFIA